MNDILVIATLVLKPAILPTEPTVVTLTSIAIAATESRGRDYRCLLPCHLQQFLLGLILDHPKLVLVQLDDLADLLAADVFQSVLLDEIFQRLLVLVDEEIGGYGRTDSIAEFVEANKLGEGDHLCCLLGIAFVAVLQMGTRVLANSLKVTGSTISAQLEEFSGLTTFTPAGEQLWAVTNYRMTSKGLRLFATCLGMGQGSWWLLERYQMLKLRILGSNSKVLYSSLSVLISKTIPATSIQTKYFEIDIKQTTNKSPLMQVSSELPCLPIQQYNQMKGQGQKQFQAERKIIKKALNSLVHKKKQIRIHFLNSNTCQVHKMDLEEHPNADMATTDRPPQEIQSLEGSGEALPLKEARFEANRSNSPNPQQDLFEVIYRNASRMQSIGWHEEIPVKRTSNMSRTFRRRRKSNLQDYFTLNDHLQLGDGENRSLMLKNSYLAVNNLELSGFTNKQILKKSAKSIEYVQSPRNGKSRNKYPHILAFIGQKNFKRAELLLPNSEVSKSIFSIAGNKLNKKWKFQAMPQSSKSARQIFNPQTSFSKWDEGNSAVRPWQKQQRGAQKGSISVQHHDHPFLKQLKPSAHTQKKKSYQKRSYSQFIRSRPNHYQNQSQKISLQEGCRPWSVFRNMDDKIDQAKPTLQQPCNQ